MVGVPVGGNEGVVDGIVGVGDVEVSDVTQINAWTDLRFVEQVDPVAARAAVCVEVLIDECPAFFYVVVPQAVGLGVDLAADEHHVLDVCRAGDDDVAEAAPAAVGRHAAVGHIHCRVVLVPRTTPIVESLYIRSWMNCAG